MSELHRWWQRGVVYEIYARSFADANGDGVGDLAGIRSRLDYLSWLGIDAIWITPTFPSPMVDGGYDVADYTGVHPLFGTLDEFDGLLADAHARSIQVLLDLVPNHTSDQHPWFVAARGSRTDPKRDWYIWRDPVDGGPPNNWLSEFGGPAWTFDPDTGQFYYHAFAAAQPDLNWRNRDVRAAMYAAMRFWLDRGVDGFRVDVMWHLIKDEAFRDNPLNPDYVEGVGSPYHRLVPVYSADQPEVHDVVAEMRAVLDEYEDRLVIGEIYLPVDRLVDYYGRDGRGAHLPFNFQLIGAAWDARQIQLRIDRYEGLLPENAWPNWVLGNHDQERLASRIGLAQARVAAVLLLTLRGTPTLYYGEELGLENSPIPAGQVDDVRELNQPGRGRDPYRTPMPWDASESAGFTSARPWLPVGEANRPRNVAAARDDPDSMLSLYRRLIGLRRREPALALGSYRSVPAKGSLLAYRRAHGGRELLIVLNLSSQAGRLKLPAEFASARSVFGISDPRPGAAHQESVVVAGDDAVILERVEESATSDPQ